MYIRESSNRDISVTACGNVFRYDVINLSIPSEESGNENKTNSNKHGGDEKTAADNLKVSFFIF